MPAAEGPGGRVAAAEAPRRPLFVAFGVPGTPNATKTRPIRPRALVRLECAGGTVVCPVEFASDLTRFSTDEPFFGTAFTGSDLGDPACDAFVAVRVTFTDPGGRAKNAFADSFTGDVFLGVDDVGSGFVAHHHVEFLDCSADCFVEYTTQPK